MAFLEAHDVDRVWPEPVQVGIFEKSLQLASKDTPWPPSVDVGASLFRGFPDVSVKPTFRLVSCGFTVLNIK